MSHPRDGMLVFEMEDMAVAPLDVDMATQMQVVDDLGLPDDLMAASRADMAGPAACHVVVNELLLSALKGSTSKASEEYVELFNQCPTSQSLKNWSLRYRSASNNSGAANKDIFLVTDLSKTIPAGGYLLYAGSQYTKTHDGSLVNGLSDAGGGVAVVNDNDEIVDSVAYGPVVASHNFLEGSAAPLPAQVAEPGQVIARTPNGTDSNDNSADFQKATPTPKAQN